MTTFADGVRVGTAFWPTALSPSTAGSREDLGVQLPTLQLYPIATASTISLSGVASAFSATATAITITATGVLVSGGVATFDYPRCVSLTATTNNSFATFTITGTDLYGQTTRVTQAGPNATTVNTLVAFKTITAVTYLATATTLSAINIGNSDTFGLPYLLANTYDGYGQYVDGAAPTSGATFTAGLATSVTVTATTGDVRGTVALATSALTNGTRSFGVQMKVTPGTATSGVGGGAGTATRLYGLTPFAG